MPLVGQGIQQLVASASQVGPNLVAELFGNVYGFIVTRISVFGPNPSSAYVYVGSITNTGLVDQTRVGWSDTSEYGDPLRIPPGGSVFVVWPNVTGSALAAFTVKPYSTGVTTSPTLG